MSNVAMWSLIIGFLSSNFVIPLIQQPVWPTQLKALVTFIYSLAIGTGNAFFAGEFNLDNWLTSVLVLLVASISIYHGFAKQMGIAPIIEDWSSPESNRV